MQKWIDLRVEKRYIITIEKGMCRRVFAHFRKKEYIRGGAKEA